MLRENHSIKDPKIIETYMHLTEREALKLIEDGSYKLAGSRTLTDLSTLDLNGSSSGDQSQKASVSNLSTIQGGEVDPHNAEYRQTQEDMDETKIHHVLSENLFTAGKKVKCKMTDSAEKGHLFFLHEKFFH